MIKGMNSVYEKTRETRGIQIRSSVIVCYFEKMKEEDVFQSLSDSCVTFSELLPSFEWLS